MNPHIHEMWELYLRESSTQSVTNDDNETVKSSIPSSDLWYCIDGYAVLEARYCSVELGLFGFGYADVCTVLEGRFCDANFCCNSQ